MMSALNSNDLQHKSEIDPYGFKHGDDFDYATYDEFMSQYLGVLARRASKWNQLLDGISRLKKSRKVKRYVRKGIPNELRGQVWMCVSKADKLMEENPGLYQRLLSEPLDPDAQSEIDTDLHRTFPENIYFGNDSPNGKRSSLRNVLTAFAQHNPDIGYCQGMNYVVAMMLIVVKDEEKSFFLFEQLTKRILVGYYSRDLKGLKVDQEVLGELVRLKEPAVSTHMEKEQVPWSIPTTKWFVCLYLDVLPIETTLRVWDCLFYEGSKIIFRVALSLVLQNAEAILNSASFPQIVEAFKHFASPQKHIDCHNFMQKVFQDSQPLKMATITKLREEFNKKI
ncbi:Growth hormone-regulated TBC protein 1-A [Holothuria leucospilota]|uniref:Growth hormone-regulated TBC protein 1 n=1 Tax=Holothuria leucospilota TaxID=206669 RepID=A0A9Q1H3C9_HOLLE|nr:Growth hormone-regulated TBC protein 1-A [Holothuria leucospilota]